MSVERTDKNSLREIYTRLYRALVNSDINVTIVTEEFRSLDTNHARVDFVYNLLRQFTLFPAILVQSKLVEVAQKYRQDGNVFFRKKQNLLALEKYNKAIASAPLHSKELALAFANRSAVFYEQLLYKECLQDINYAFSNNYPDHLRDKLLERKRKAELLLPNQVVQKKYYLELPQLTYSPHPVVECGGDCIEVKFEQRLGRHVVATRDLRVGDIIAIERPFTQILLKDNYLTHCYQCLIPCYNLIPCRNCVLVLFCSKSCKDKSYHKYECPILGTLLDLQVNNLELIALKICMLVESQEFNKRESVYKSERYDEIHNLVGNTHIRSVSDLFERAVKSAVIFELAQKYTHYFDDKGDQRRQLFKELLLLHMQTGPSNFHEISELRRVNGDCQVVELGSGAYGFLSLLNHSCSPNVVRHCYGNAIVLRALNPIKAGQQLFDNYGYHHAVMAKPERQSYLKSQYYFECICEACNNNWPLYQELPVIGFDIDVSDFELRLLGDGDRSTAKNLLEKTESLAEKLEKYKPCKEFSDVQEIVKQCYAICGNKFEMF